VRDCDEAVKRGRELSADNKLIAKALTRKAAALIKLADCAKDYAPAIRALRQSLDEHHSEETLEKLNKAESARNELEAQEQLHEAADQHRERGLRVARLWHCLRVWEMVPM
jgi:transposase